MPDVIAVRWRRASGVLELAHEGQEDALVGHQVDRARV